MKTAKKNMEIEEINSINKVILMGKVDEIIKYQKVSKNEVFFKFTVHTEFSWVDPVDNLRKYHNDFHKVVVWGDLAEICKKSLKKGKKVYVEGKLQIRYWEDSEGRGKFSIEIFGDEVKLLT